MVDGAEEPIRVLVVDDDPYLRVMLSLELPDVELLEAASADEAIVLATDETPDIVLVDIRLPGVDGLELIREMRHEPSLERVPVIVITAGHDEARRAEVLRAGADEYLPKPIDVADLVARMERVLGQHPDERRPRRLKLIGRLEGGGGVGDPDPLPAGATDAVAARREQAPRRRGLLARFRRG